MKLAKVLVSENIQPISFFTVVNKQEVMVNGGAAKAVRLKSKNNKTGILESVIKKAIDEVDTSPIVIKQAAG